MKGTTQNLKAEFEKLKETYANDLTIDNRELMDKLYNYEHRQVAAKMMHLIASKQADSYIVPFEKCKSVKNKTICIFPVITDYIQSFLNYNKVSLRDTDEVAESKFWTLCKVAFKTHDHILIGHEMQLTDYQISIYDAINGKFLESYNPRMVKVTRDFSAYLQRQTYIEITVEKKNNGDQTFSAETTNEWRDELQRLYDKYNAHPLDEDKAFEYLLKEVLWNFIEVSEKRLYAFVDKIFATDD